MLGDQSLEGLSVHLVGIVERALRAQCPEDTRVEQVELLPAYRVAFRALAEHGQAKSEQRVLQDVHVADHDLPVDFALPRDRCEIELRAVGERDGFKEASEATDVAGEPLGPYFLVQVKADVAIQGALGVGRAGHQRQQAVRQRTREIELR